MSDADVTIAEAPERERYEISVDAQLAGFLEYRGGGEVRALVHTEIDPAFEGQGLGGKLVRFVLDDVRARGMQIVPICPFVHRFLAGHEEYLDLMQPHIRKAFHL